MSGKVKRYQRVKDARQKALDAEQGRLAEAMVEVSRAREAHEAAQRKAAQAREERLSDGSSLGVDEWRAREAWIVELGRRVEFAATDVERADVAVLEARARVAAAKAAVEQIDVLVRRAKDEQARAEGAAEQRVADELAARRRGAPSA